MWKILENFVNPRYYSVHLKNGSYYGFTLKPAAAAAVVRRMWSAAIRLSGEQREDRCTDYFETRHGHSVGGGGVRKVVSE